MRESTEKTYMLLIVTIVLVITAIIDYAYSSPASKNSDGNRYYNQKQYSSALKEYKEALIEAPSLNEIRHNIGNVYYRQRKYDKAVEEYQKSAMPKDSKENRNFLRFIFGKKEGLSLGEKIQNSSYYNLGNAHYRQGKLLEAIECYKNALKIAPDDFDAKYNLEFARMKLKEMMQKQQKQQKEQKPQKQKQGNKQEKKESQKDAQKQKSKMTKEDAERMLNAIKNDEKNMQKKVKQMQGFGEYRVEKDW